MPGTAADRTTGSAAGKTSAPTIIVAADPTRGVKVDVSTIAAPFRAEIRESVRELGGQGIGASMRCSATRTLRKRRRVCVCVCVRACTPCAVALVVVVLPALAFAFAVLVYSFCFTPFSFLKYWAELLRSSEFEI